MELAEVYRVIYNGPDDKLRGMIVCANEENGFQYLFKNIGSDNDNIVSMVLKYDTGKDYKEDDKQLDLSSKQVIKYGDHIMLTGPTNSSIAAESGFSIKIYLFGVMHGYLTFDFPYGEPEMLSRPLRRAFVSKDGSRSLTILYAMFENALEAHVYIKVAEVKSAFNLHGIVVARTSAIWDVAYSSILFFKEQGDKMEVRLGEEKNISLSRSLVAVPKESDLIIGLNLLSDDNVNMIEHTLIFEPKRDRTSSEPESYLLNLSNCVIKVEVSWSSKRKPREPVHMNNGS